MSSLGHGQNSCHQKSCSEIFHFLRIPLMPPAQLTLHSHVSPAPPAPPCHIPACLVPTAAACMLLHRRAQLCHTCIPSSPKFSTVDSRPGELQHLLLHLPVPQLNQFPGVPDLPVPRSSSTADSKPCPRHGQAPQPEPWGQFSGAVTSICTDTPCDKCNPLAQPSIHHSTTPRNQSKLAGNLASHCELCSGGFPARASRSELVVCVRLLPLATAFAQAHHSTPSRLFMNDLREGTPVGHEPRVLTL